MLFIITVKNEKERPVILHRAVFGSMERFMSILIERYAGKMPFWLAPHQVGILSISNKCNDYCEEISNTLQKFEYRVFEDFSSSSIKRKIKNGILTKLPYMLIIGEKRVSK